MVQQRGATFRITSRTARTPVRTDDPLPELIREADHPLYVLQSVFPFMLFPDKIIIRTNHIDVIRGVFFWSAASIRMQIQDIRQVSVRYNPFFATLEIVPQGPREHSLEVNYLWKSEAKKARRIVAGLIESHEKKVDFAKYTLGSLVPAMEKIGQAME